MLYATLCFMEIYQTSRQHIDILDNITANTQGIFKSGLSDL